MTKSFANHQRGRKVRLKVGKLREDIKNKTETWRNSRRPGVLVPGSGETWRTPKELGENYVAPCWEPGPIWISTNPKTLQFPSHPNV